MIVFDLKCARTHVFEAWFGSSADYEDQRTRGLLSCPICGDAHIAKAVMAPNVAAKGNRAAAAPAASPDPKALMAALAQVQATMLEGSQWVGMSFADKARAMHAGEETVAPIHGQASLSEAKALIDDGVPVAPLPLPVIPPDQRN
ncbi:MULTISPECIES: DUF1178 family protein [unclassified Sphingomonas]|uniref:DUF1178 family protein n=1 Tax=unclassified Sphingomonas TaxID=196159 RepID=UPI002151FB0E|nr:MULTISPECIES: DUF1178 family protein [unclassified Sphingomonas]MCR5872642.1 DUF1178 family protein [Sphingomonas sp. J344]UUX99074.1 DUF1178 family protein [Sphingomonas sp. J315]